VSTDFRIEPEKGKIYCSVIDLSGVRSIVFDVILKAEGSYKGLLRAKFSSRTCLWIYCTKCIGYYDAGDYRHTSERKTDKDAARAYIFGQKLAVSFLVCQVLYQASPRGEVRKLF
jgi:hypothetical protein